MSQRSTQHATFVIDRHFDALPAQVFAAWSTPEAKGRWFAGPNERIEDDREMDFRVGGREYLKGVWPGGKVSIFDARYHDIVPGERIVYTYTMHVNDAKISVSLATVEFRPAGTGTRLTVTEQGAFLDGYDDAGAREKGTAWLLDNLEKSLRP